MTLYDLRTLALGWIADTANAVAAWAETTRDLDDELAELQEHH